MDDAVHWTIFFETCHALRLGMNETDAKPGMFQRRAFGQFAPVILERVPIEFGQFAQRQMDVLDARRLRVVDHLFDEGFDGLKFAHGWADYTQDLRFIPSRRLILLNRHLILML